MSPSLHPSGLTLDFMVPKNVHFELTPWLDIPSSVPHPYPGFSSSL